jgi:hypothetical protein
MKKKKNHSLFFLGYGDIVPSTYCGRGKIVCFFQFI